MAGRKRYDMDDYDGTQPLPDPRHEQVAQVYIQTGRPTDAYLSAYTGCKRTSARVNASRLLSTPGVRARVEYLRGQLADKYGVRTDDLIGKALRIYDMATDPDADPKRYTGRDAMQALSLIATLTGAADAHRREILARQAQAAEDRVALERERNDILGQAQQVIVQIPGVARPGLDAGTVVQAVPGDYTVADDQPADNCGHGCGQVDGQ